jgi:hypothetical protein
MTPDLARLQLGRETLARIEALGLDVTGAAWMRDEDSNSWVFEVATPLVDSHGPKWIYDRLAPIVAHMPLPAGIHMLQVRLASPGESLWRTIAKNFAVETAAVMTEPSVSEGVPLPEMLLLRSRRHAGNAEQSAARLDRQYRELAGA